MNEGYFTPNGRNNSADYGFSPPFSGGQGNKYAQIIHETSNSYGFPYADGNLKTLIQATPTCPVTLTICDDDVPFGYDSTPPGPASQPSSGSYQFGIGSGSGELGVIKIGGFRYLANDSGAYGGFLPTRPEWTRMYFSGAGHNKYIWYRTVGDGQVEAKGCFTGGAPAWNSQKVLTWGAGVSWKPGADSPAFPGTSVYLRDNFQDHGQVPSVGCPYRSPDIIPMKSGSLTWQRASETYSGPDLGHDIVPHGNNIYIRARHANEAPDPATATVELYAAKASLLVSPQIGSWTQLRTEADKLTSVELTNSSGTNSLAPGAVALSTIAFHWDNVPAPGAHDHYCLVAFVNSELNELPKSWSSNVEFVQFVQNHPMVSWRNVSYDPNGATEITRRLDFGNLNAKGETLHFKVEARRYPTGTTLKFCCPQCEPPIDVSMTLPKPNPNGIQITGFDHFVPGSFKGTVSVTATAPTGSSFPAGAELIVSYLQYPSMEVPLELEVARDVEVARILSPERVHSSVMQMLEVGACVFEIR